MILQAVLDLYHLVAVLLGRRAHDALPTDEDSSTTDEDSSTTDEDSSTTDEDSLPADENSTEARDPVRWIEAFGQKDDSQMDPPKPILFLWNSASNSIRQHLDVECRPFYPYFKVYPKDEKEERWILTILEAEGIGYFRHNNLHSFKVVIRGLPVDAVPDTIRDSLMGEGFPVIKVVQMRDNISGRKIPLFLVHLVESDKCEDIFNLTRLDDMEISVKKYRRGWVRCFSCQLYGHTSNNCHMQVRCMYCGLGHKSRTCAIRKYPSMHRCIHCGGPHKCSSVMCPVRPTW